MSNEAMKWLMHPENTLILGVFIGFVVGVLAGMQIMIILVKLGVTHE